MNYKSEIQRMLARIPQSVLQGDINKARDWKNTAEKARSIARKSRASEAELLRAYSELKAYE